MHLHDQVLKGIQRGSDVCAEGNDLRMTFVQGCIDIIAEHVSMLTARSAEEPIHVDYMSWYAEQRQPAIDVD